MKVSKKSLAGIALGVAGVALTIILGNRWGNADHALTMAPPRKAEALVHRTTQSYVSLPIRLSSTAMTDMANKLVPMSFEIPRQQVFHDRAWTKNLINGNEITLWSITINGYGTISRKTLAVETTDGAIHVSMPIHGWFRAYKGGSHETAEADADVRVTAAFDVGEDWNPVVTPSVNYHWVNRPEARLFGLFTLSLGSLAERQINTQVRKLKAQLPVLLEKN